MPPHFKECMTLNMKLNAMILKNGVSDFTIWKRRSLTNG